MRDIRYMNFVSGQKIENDEVMKRLGELCYRNIGNLMRISLFDSGKAIITGDGLRVETSSGMTINVPSGLTAQRTEDMAILPCIQTEAQTITLDAASGFSRIDTIEAQVKTVTDKNDTAQVAVVSGGSSVVITNTAIKRDVKYYLAVQKKTGVTALTAATAATVTGTADLSSPINLSAKYLLNIADGEDGSFIEVDCRGATPSATTRAEIISALNAALGRVATSASTDYIKYTGENVGVSSYFKFRNPSTNPDLDALALIFGLADGGLYKYEYRGVDGWFKLAEIDVGAATAVVTSGLIRNVNEKDTWANSDGDDVIVRNPSSQEPLEISDTTDSTSKDTGSIVTEGGIGVEKSVVTGGKITIKDTTDSASKDTGALIIEGGIGVEKSINIGGTLKVSNVSVSGFSVDDIPIYTKIFEIGDWNMDTTGTLNVAHGLDWTKIRSVDIIIRDDANTFHFPINYDVTSARVGGSYYISPTNIVLVRFNLAYFDGAGFSSTPYNRGWVTVKYI